MRKSHFLAMLLMPCVSFAGLLGSSSPVTPVGKGIAAVNGYRSIFRFFKERRTLDLYVKMGEQYQLLDSYKICNYSGGLRPETPSGRFKKSGRGFTAFSAINSKPDSRFYKAINIGFPSTCLRSRMAMMAEISDDSRRLCFRRLLCHDRQRH